MDAWKHAFTGGQPKNVPNASDTPIGGWRHKKVTTPFDLKVVTLIT